MHRSGTSLVSRVVNLLGASLGPEDLLMAPKPDNPTGFWESGPVTKLNDDLLAALGGRWDDPPAPADGWELDGRLDPFRQRAADAMAAFGETELAAFKDPRASLTLPFWRTVVPIAGTILVVRQPGEVVESLNRRDGMDSAHAADLWLRYVAAASHHDPGHLLVRYEAFFDDLEGTTDRIAKHLGATVPDGAREQIAAFFDPALRHPGTATDDPGLALADAIFGVLDEPAVAGPILDAFYAAAVGRTVTADLSKVIEERDAAVRLRDETAAQLAQAAAQRDEMIEDRNRALALREESANQATELAAHRDELIEERDVAVAQRDDLAEEKRRLTERIEVQGELMGTLEQANAELAARAADGEGRLAETRRRLDRRPWRWLFRDI